MKKRGLSLVMVDILIIGSGAAGLGLALSLADQARIALISKGDLKAGSSQHAQGGIAAVMNQAEENIALHISDTLKTGAGLCDPKVVAFTVRNAKSAIDWLVEHGVKFTTQQHSKKFHLTQEGGHSQRRILHADDKTGAEVVGTLVEQVFSHPNIICFSDHAAIDLIVENNQCIGAHVLNDKTGEVIPFYAKETVLACGGASSAYQFTTNPDFTSGDGIAMAYRAGCRVKNMEFNQFHPTMLYAKTKKPFLISEVLRGEGAKLILPNGERFMSKYDERAEMAPRDVVSRAIDNELKKNKLDCVYLDISHESPEMIQRFFPTIYTFCLEQGIDITKEPIPVVPAAHYTCGGVVTNLKGQTDVAHLYAIGEVACTGLHGANRMASNSLLECLVFAASAAKAIKKVLKELDPVIKPRDDDTTKPQSNDTSLDPTAKTQSNNVTLNPTAKTQNNHVTLSSTARLQDNTATPPSSRDLSAGSSYKKQINQIKKTMWHHVGIIRNNKELLQAQKTIVELDKQIQDLFSNEKITKNLIELRNLSQVSLLIIEAAIARKASCGLHYNIDYPENLSCPAGQNTELA